MNPAPRILVVILFAIAMAYVEAAAVAYLREAYGINDLLSDLPDRPDRLVAIELGREFATLVMLATVGILAGKRLQDRTGYFVLAFGAWDLAYYAWLSLFVGWPRSPFDWDVLFLLPLPWWGPVIAPAVIAMMMCVGGAATIVQADRGIAWRLDRLNVGLAAAGIAIVLFTFMFDAIGAVPDGLDAVAKVRPSEFLWTLFIAGFVVMSWAGLRVTWPRPSRLLLIDA